MNVKFFRFNRQLEQVGAEIKKALSDVVDSGVYAYGSKCRELEEKWAAKVNQKYCLAVNNGTSALHVALMALTEWGKKHVITSPATFIATCEAVISSNNSLDFLDIDKTCTIDVLEENDSCYDRKIYLPVSLYGNAPDLINLKKNTKTVPILLDNSQGHLCKLNGKYLEEYCDITASSTYCTKNWGATGEGGVITTDNKDLYDYMVKYTSHGQEGKYNHVLCGFNFRMPELIAASLLVKLNYLEEWNEKRKEIARQYRENLKDIKGITLMEERGEPVYHQFPIFVPQPEKLANYLSNNGVETNKHYPVPCHLSKSLVPHTNTSYRRGDFPQAEKWADTEISLPMFPELTKDEVGYTSEKVIEFFKR